MEVFIFLSGLGLFYSMSNNSNLVKFYENRVKRLIIPYAIVGIIFWDILDLIINKGSIVDVIKDFTFITLVTKGERTIWFTGVIFIFYLIFPLIYKLINSKRGLIKTVILMLVVYAVNYAIWQLWPNIYDNIEIGAMRLPCFILGALCAYLIKNNIENKRIIPILIIMGLILKIVADILLNVPLYYSRIVAVCYAVSLILIVCFLLEKLQCAKFNNAMTWIGKYSLELYMIHVCIRKIMKSIGTYTCELSIYVGIIAISVVLSLLLHKMVEKIESYSYHHQNLK